MDKLPFILPMSPGNSVICLIECECFIIHLAVDWGSRDVRCCSACLCVRIVCTSALSLCSTVTYASIDDYYYMYTETCSRPILCMYAFEEKERVKGKYTGWPKNNGTVDFLELCSDQQLSFFTLLDRTSFPHYNNIKIIKFGWKLFILWVIYYGLSFSGFAINFSWPPKKRNSQLFRTLLWWTVIFITLLDL